MERAIADQLEALHPEAFGWALHCCGGEHARAEDVLQNAYVKVAQERARHDGRSSFKTWWFGVIRFTAHEEFRRLRYRESLLGKMLLQLTGEVHDSRPSPARRMELDERAAELRLATARKAGGSAASGVLPGSHAQRSGGSDAGEHWFRAPALRTRQGAPAHTAAPRPFP